jgi:NDP-sugar pyrophosphorylase family protein
MENGDIRMKELSNITAVILAGGFGTRLRSVVGDNPKVLASVCGRPFIEYLLDQLVLEGVQSVVLCTGYLGDQVQNQLGATYRNLWLHYSHEQHPLGTGGALRLALSMIESDPVLVLNGDSYCDVRFNELISWHYEHCSAATILLAEENDTRRYGRVQFNAEGHILQFVEKMDAQGPGWVNAGIYLLGHKIIESIEPGRAVSIEREVFPSWIGRGLHGLRSKGRLWDIGVPDAYAKANAEFAGRIEG